VPVIRFRGNAGAEAPVPVRRQVSGLKFRPPRGQRRQPPGFYTKMMWTGGSTSGVARDPELRKIVG
jgi:hypothetical protein